MEESKTIKSKENFDMICSVFEENEWPYEKTDDSILLKYSENMSISLRVDAKREIVLVSYKLPVKTPEDKRVDLAIATNAINYRLALGHFVYNFVTGDIEYRSVSSFHGKTISKDVLIGEVKAAEDIIDEYNYQFLKIAKDLLSTKEFLASLK